jgi:curved DNA-binding protein CbpA
MSGQTDYYAILGLKPGAKLEEIKKRYRELARRYHPDVNPSPDAAQKIKAVNEAYHVLGDIDRRATYDAEILLRQRAAPPATTRPASPPANAPRSTPPGQRPGSPTDKMEFDGFGRKTTTPASSPQRPSSPQPQSRPTAAREPSKATSPFGTVERIIAEAQLAFINRKFKDAEELCKQALVIDRRHAVAHEILGDIHAKRGDKDRASVSYSYAVQLNPRNVSVQAKLERLTGGIGAVKGSAGPTMTRPVATPAWERFSDGPEREAFLVVLTLVFGALWLGMTILLALHPGLPMDLGLSWISDLSFNLFGVLAVNGAVSGILLAFHGGMRPFPEELLSRDLSPDERRTPVTLGAVLVFFSLLWFYASVLVYFGIAFARNKFSASVLRVYGVALFQIILFAALFRPDRAPNAGMQMALWGGNILFPAMLFGWAVGDAIRLRKS